MTQPDPITSQEATRERRRAGMIMLGGGLLAALLRPALVAYVGSGVATGIVLGVVGVAALIALRRLVSRP